MWEFGVELRAHRERARLSVRGAARMAGISEGRWRQLENGYKSASGSPEPISTTPKTVLKAARAVLIADDRALSLAGFDPRVYLPARPEPGRSPLALLVTASVAAGRMRVLSDCLEVES